LCNINKQTKKKRERKKKLTDVDGVREIIRVFADGGNQ